MFIAKNLMWPTNSDGRVEISIGFLHGDKHHSRQKDVKHIAHAWEKAVPCLKFHWKDNLKHCHVRIEFWDSLDGISSIGIEAKDISSHKESTMSLPKNSDYQILKERTLHEFGHMLGAIHEVHNPSFPYKWNKEAIIKYYEDDLKDTGDNYGNELSSHELHKRAKQEAQVLWKDVDVNEDERLYSRFDPISIMVSPIRVEWIEKKHHHDPEPESTEIVDELSDLDKSTMREAYSGQSIINQSLPSQQGEGRYYPYQVPYFPSVSNQSQPISYPTPFTNNICGNPDCGWTFICKEDYNRRVRACGAPGIP